MKEIKKLLSLVLVFAVVLSVIPAVSVEAKSGVIKKTAKKKFVIEKFDDQDYIDEFEKTDTVALVNECGGWYGITNDYGYTWNDDGEYIQTDEEGTYLGVFDWMTVAQTAKSLKNMYGKYACVKKADLKNNNRVSTYWLFKQLIKIAKKRGEMEVVDLLTPYLVDELKGEYITKPDYAYTISECIATYPLMDPRVNH